MEWLALLVGILGLGSTFAWIYERWLRRVGARRRIGLRASSVVDVVCTTSEESVSSWGSSAALRALAPEGELQAVSAIANALGRWYPRTDLRIQMADRATYRLQGDLILIGGPSGNQSTAQVLAWPTLTDLVKIDAPSSSLEAGDFSIEGYSHDMESMRPKRDLGVILCSRNQWSPGSRGRLLLFAGLTTYGTGAAADYFFTAIGRGGNMERKLSRCLNGGQTVVIVVEATFSQGYLSGCRVLHWDAASSSRARGAAAG